MNAALVNNQREFGGKNGTLITLRDYPDVRDAIVPLIVLKVDESISSAVRTEVAAALSAWSVSEVIVRASECSDWAGMVGVMDTKRCPVSELDKMVDAVFKSSKNPKLVEYSVMEASGYRPVNFTVSVSPYLRCHYLCTVTEHPHSEAIFIDFEYKSDDVSVYDSFNWSPHKVANVHGTSRGYSKFIKAVLGLRNRIRETGLFDDSDALQCEMGLYGKMKAPLLFQIRKFASRSVINSISVSASHRSYTLNRARIFGVTPEEGITLPVSNDDYRDDAILAGNKAFPDGYILHPDISSMSLDFDGSPRMKAYIPARGRSIPLGHNHTRFVMHAMQRGGVALLGFRGPAVKHGKNVTIISNGKEAILKY